MGTFKRFTDIAMWQMARDQAKVIWEVSNLGSFEMDFGLKDQINRSGGSVMDNIAEGFGRGGNREFITFLGYARASNDEVQSQLYRAFDRMHIDSARKSSLVESSKSIGTKINNLIVYLRQSDYRGQKFNKK